MSITVDKRALSENTASIQVRRCDGREWILSSGKQKQMLYEQCDSVTPVSRKPPGGARSCARPVVFSCAANKSEGVRRHRQRRRLPRGRPARSGSPARRRGREAEAHHGPAAAPSPFASFPSKTRTRSMPGAKRGRGASAKLMSAAPGSNAAPSGRPRRRRPPHGAATEQLCPPSTGSATPVINRASSEARNTAAAATSHAVPILPIGTRRLRAATISSADA